MNHKWGCRKPIRVGVLKIFIMFCKKCGKDVNDEAVICIGCGCSLIEEKTLPSQSNEGAGCFLSGLSFLFPLLGLILYFVWKDSKPQASKDAGKAALWGVAIGIVTWVISMVVLTSAVGSGYYF